MNAAKTLSVTAVIDCMFDVKNAMNYIRNKIIAINNREMETLKSKKYSMPSYLLSENGSSTYDTLVNFDWETCVNEFHLKFPLLCSALIGIMLPSDKHVADHIESVVPKLGLIYGIIAQNRIHYLSKVQRIMTAVLTDNLADVKVNLSLMIV